MQVTMRINLPATVKKKAQWYVSTCPVLDVSSQGETKEKALENLAEALKTFLLSCYERGTLDQVMKESGFVAAKEVKRIPRNYETLDIPLPFMIDKTQRITPCHV